MNTSFKHFIYFVNQFGLVESKELAPLEELIEALIEDDVCNDEVLNYK